MLFSHLVLHFGWDLAQPEWQGKISTADILRGLTSDNILDICYLCRGERESIDHWFIHCDTASFIWGYLLKVSGVSRCLSGTLPILFQGWKGTPLEDLMEDHSSLYFGQFGKSKMIAFLKEKDQQGRIYCQLCFQGSLNGLESERILQRLRQITSCTTGEFV